MENLFQLIEAVHILNGLLLFASIFGVALPLWALWRGGDVRAIAAITGFAARTGMILTLVFGLIQPLSGFTMVRLMGFDPLQDWLVLAYGTYSLAILAWTAQAMIQARLARQLKMACTTAAPQIPAETHKFMKIWTVCALLSTAGLITTVFIMVLKPTWS